MKRKQRKSLPWRRFGYVILIIIKFGELLLWISLRIINVLRSYIKHSKECFIRYPNTSKLVKKTRLPLVFSTHFSVCLDIWWNTLPPKLANFFKFPLWTDRVFGPEFTSDGSTSKGNRELYLWSFDEKTAKVPWHSPSKIPHKMTYDLVSVHGHRVTT